MGNTEKGVYQFRAFAGPLLPALITAVVSLLYLLPNGIEAALLKWGVPAGVLVMFGDLAGCAVVALLVSAPCAVGIYLAAAALELLLLRYGRIQPAGLLWITDLGPMLAVAVWIAYMTGRGLNWRHRAASQPGGRRSDESGLSGMVT